jgi:hypothetical protein
MVCPHDTASNPDKWYHFAQYLTQSITNSVQFEKSMDFPDFHGQLSSGGLIYANPQDSLRLIKENGYIPIARSSNLFDEIVFIANKSVEDPQIIDLANNDVISVNSMLVTRVGIKFLFDQDIHPSRLKPAESWMAVVKAIFRGEEKYGFVYKDFYDGLNSLSKSGLQKIAETYDGTIHHNLLLAPQLESVSLKLQLCLIEMHEQGERENSILKDLGIDQFMAVNKEDILDFESLLSLGDELMDDKQAVSA